VAQMESDALARQVAIAIANASVFDAAGSLQRHRRRRGRAAVGRVMTPPRLTLFLFSLSLYESIFVARAVNQGLEVMFVRPGERI
jgi:GAF domain-containing protein